uniref:Protein phosphatase 1 regulatory subunit 21 N-terminal domain-containing protein n=1 Tax=Panagrolaimus sp. PS1159 TaxID=55785 RepID=A0AC35FRT9_9BILA
MTTTISENITDDKYQKLSVEFAKLRNQIPTLKDDLDEEKKKNKLLKDEIRILDIDLRKSRSENESLIFRNEQLLRRIEALQANLDSATNGFAQAKAKKKHKEANLRLFGAQQMEAGSSQDGSPPNDPRLILEQELERKLAENAELHSTIYDMERQHETVVTEFSAIVKKLENEKDSIKKALNEQTKNGGIENGDDDYEMANGSGLSSEKKQEEDISNFISDLLTTSQNSIEAMTKFFEQIDKKLVIFPCDATLESVPEDIHLFGLECGKMAEALLDIKGEIAALQLNLKEVDGMSDLIGKLPEIREKLGKLFASSIKEIQPLLKTCQRKECDAPCIHDALVELKKIFHRFRDIFGKKIFIENHLPTTSKKLKGYNESIEKALMHLVQGITKLQTQFEDKEKVGWFNEIFFVKKSAAAIKTNGFEPQKKMSALQKQASIIEESNSKLSDLKVQLVDCRNENSSFKKQINDLSKDVSLKDYKIEELENKISVLTKQIEILKGSTEDIKKLRMEVDKSHGLEDYRIIEFYFLQEVNKVVTELNHVQGKVQRYRRDIDDLTMVLQNLDVEHNESKKIIDERELECQELRDELETIRHNYEEQLRVMSEHLAVINSEASNLQTSSPPTTSVSSATTTSNSLKDNLRKIVRK